NGSHESAEFERRPACPRSHARMDSVAPARSALPGLLLRKIPFAVSQTAQVPERESVEERARRAGRRCPRRLRLQRQKGFARRTPRPEPRSRREDRTRLTRHRLRRAQPNPTESNQIKPNDCSTRIWRIAEWHLPLPGGAGTSLHRRFPSGTEIL